VSSVCHNYDGRRNINKNAENEINNVKKKKRKEMIFISFVCPLLSLIQKVSSSLDDLR